MGVRCFTGAKVGSILSSHITLITDRLYIFTEVLSAECLETGWLIHGIP